MSLAHGVSEREPIDQCKPYGRHEHMEVPTPPMMSQGLPYKSHISLPLAHVSVQVEAEQRVLPMNHDLEQRHLLLVCWQHFAVLVLVLAYWRWF